MTPDYLKQLLEQYKTGALDAETVVEELSKLPYEELGFAKLDHHRAVRTGYPEVIYGEGKTPGHAADIFGKLAQRNPIVLCTRASLEVARAIRMLCPEAVYHETCRVVEYRGEPVKAKGLVVVICAGTSDLSVAEEAAVVLEAFGSKVERIFDVGVAGIHRLLRHAGPLRRANCVVSVAGMEGALPSVVAGLVDVPVIAVPTSVGYGTSFGGIAPLLTMLNACSTGVSVVNIDNGFGAAVQADMINKLAVSRPRTSAA